VKKKLQSRDMTDLELFSLKGLTKRNCCDIIAVDEGVASAKNAQQVNILTKRSGLL